jgi:hypothetical protein
MLVIVCVNDKLLAKCFQGTRRIDKPTVPTTSASKLNMSVTLLEHLNTAQYESALHTETKLQLQALCLLSLKCQPAVRLTSLTAELQHCMR